MMVICTSVPSPPIRAACPGGSGFDDIWCAASVMPYASSTGAPNAASRSCITCGGSEALQERMNRSFAAPAGGRPVFTRASSNWWIVGTAEYHVAPCPAPSARRTAG